MFQIVFHLCHFAITLQGEEVIINGKSSKNLSG